MKRREELISKIYDRLKEYQVTKEDIEKKFDELLISKGFATFNMLENSLQDIDALKNIILAKQSKKVISRQKTSLNIDVTEDRIKKNVKRNNEEFETIDVKKINIKYALGIDEEKQKIQYKNMLNLLSPEAVKSQARQIINYADNYTDGEIPITTLFANCSLQLKKHLKEDDNIANKEYEDFKKSLDTSQDCILNQEMYLEKIAELENNNAKSFLVVPIFTDGHVFSLAIFKKDDNYEVVAVNKGARGYDSSIDYNKLHSTFEKYIIPEKNIDNIIPILKGTFDVNKIVLEDNTTKKTGKIYDALAQNTKEKKGIELVDMSAKDQVIGNCYYKEVEEGLKYVYSYAFDSYKEISYDSTSKGKVRLKVPKFPIKTEDFHKELLNNIKEMYDNKDVKEYIDELTEIYEQNKEFRDTMDYKKYASKAAKKEVFLAVFGDKSGNLKDKEYLKKCLKNVDEKTLREHTDFFIDLLKECGVQVPMIMYEQKDVALSRDFLTIGKNYIMKTGNTSELNFLYEYFPRIYDNLLKQIDRDEFAHIYREIYKYTHKEYYKDSKSDNEIVDIINKGLLLNLSPSSKAYLYYSLANIKYKQAKLEEAADLIKKAIKLVDGSNFAEAKTYISVYNNIVDIINNDMEYIKSQLFKEDVSGNRKRSLKREPTSIGQEQSVLRNAEISRNKANDDDNLTILELANKIKLEKKKQQISEYREKIKDRDNSVYSSEVNDVTYNLAKLLKDVGQKEDALLEYKDYLNHSYKEEVLNDYISILRELGRSDEALNEIDRIFEGKKSGGLAVEIDFLTQRIDCLMDLKRDEEALRACEYFLYKAPKVTADVSNKYMSKYYEIASKRAKLLDELGYYEKAKQSYEYLLAFDPNNRMILKNIQEVSEKMNELKDNTTVYKKPVEHTDSMSRRVHRRQVRKNVQEEKKQYIEDINKLKIDTVKNQVSQILNYERNIGQSDDLPTYTMIENCSIVLKESIAEGNVLFEDSLKNSKECIINKGEYINKIKALEDNNDNSFVLLPIDAYGHRFSAAIYKKGETYEIITINKGERDIYNDKELSMHHMFEKYIIPKVNIEKVVNNIIARNVNERKKPVDEIYEELRKNAMNGKYERLENIDAKEQITGNCFYKEVEEGLKYVYSRAYDNYEISDDGKTKIPKFPQGTQKFHERLLNNIKFSYNNKEVKDFIDDILVKYDKNKVFRDKINENENLSVEEKKEQLLAIFRHKQLDLKDKNELKECLKDVDGKTFISDIDFFLGLVKEAGVVLPSEMMILKHNKHLEYLSSFIKRKGQDIDVIKEFFPTALKTLDATEIFDDSIQELKLKVANLSNNQKYYDEKKANKILRQADELLKLDLDKWQKMNVYVVMGDLNTYKGDIQNALNFYNLAKDISRNIGNSAIDNMLDMQIEIMNKEKMKYDYSSENSMQNNLKAINKKDINKKDINSMKRSLDELMQEGELEKALEQSNIILMRNNKSLSTMKKRLGILVKLEKSGEALKQSEDILKKNPIDIKTLRTKGKILISLNKKDELMNVYTAILKIKNNDFSANMGKIFLLLQNDKGQEALDLVDKQLKRTKVDITSNSLMAKTKIYLMKNKIKEHLHYQEIKINCLLELNEQQKALEMCKERLETAKLAYNFVDYNTRMILAEILYKKGRVKEALEEYQKVGQVIGEDREIKRKIQKISKEIEDATIKEKELSNLDVKTLTTKNLNCLDKEQLMSFTKEQIQALNKEQLENLNLDAVGSIMNKLSTNQMTFLTNEAIIHNEDRLKQLNFDQYKALDENNKLMVFSKSKQLQIKISCAKNIGIPESIKDIKHENKTKENSISLINKMFNKKVKKERNNTREL